MIIPAGGAVESPLNNAYEYSTITRERFDYGKRELPSTGAANAGGLLSLGAVLIAAGGISLAGTRRRGRRS